jgi:hypothetical protein
MREAVVIARTEGLVSKLLAMQNFFKFRSPELYRRMVNALNRLAARYLINANR